MLQATLEVNIDLGAKVPLRVRVKLRTQRNMGDYCVIEYERLLYDWIWQHFIIADKTVWKLASHN